MLAWAGRSESSDLVTLLRLTCSSLASVSPCSTPADPVFLGSSSTFLRRPQGQGAMESEALCLTPASPYLRHRPNPENPSKRWGVGVAECVASGENLTAGDWGQSSHLPPTLVPAFPTLPAWKECAAPTPLRALPSQVNPRTHSGHCRPGGNMWAQASPLSRP